MTPRAREPAPPRADGPLAENRAPAPRPGSAAAASTVCQPGRGSGRKINGITSTRATKGNEKEIGRKLELETRSAGEYFHIEKLCFQKNESNITGRGSTEFISAGPASITTAEMEDSQSSEITLWAARALPARPGPARPRPRPCPQPWGPREAGQPGPRPLVAIPAPEKRISQARPPTPSPPAPAPSPGPHRRPHRRPHRPPRGSGSPSQSRTWPSSRARPLEGARLSWKTGACFCLRCKPGTRHND